MYRNIYNVSQKLFDLSLSQMTLEENGFKVDSFADPLSVLKNFKEEAGMYELLILDIKCQI